MEVVSQIDFTEHFRIAVIDYSEEIKDGQTPPCFDLEHRNGECPFRINHRGLKLFEGTNTVTNTVRQSIIKQMCGLAAKNLAITQIAFGTSSDPTPPTLVQPVTEFGRVAPSATTPNSDTTLSAYWFLGSSVGNAPSDLQEWCVMADGATSAVGSGSAIARFLYQFTKNTSTTASGQWDLTIN